MTRALCMGLHLAKRHVIAIYMYLLCVLCVYSSQFIEKYELSHHTMKVEMLIEIYCLLIILFI